MLLMTVIVCCILSEHVQVYVFLPDVLEIQTPPLVQLVRWGPECDEIRQKSEERRLTQTGAALSVVCARTGRSRLNAFSKTF